MEKLKILPLPDHLLKQIRAMLLDDEQLLWATQPAKWRFMRDGWELSVSGMAGFVIVALIFASLPADISTRYNDVRNGQIFFRLLLGFFGILSLFFMFMPVWIYHTRAPVYAITSKRIIILNTGFFRTLPQSFGKRDITQLTVTELKNGYGDLIFGSQIVARAVIPVSLRGVPDVQGVRQLIQETFDIGQHDFWQN